MNKSIIIIIICVLNYTNIVLVKSTPINNCYYDGIDYSPLFIKDDSYLTYSDGVFYYFNICGHADYCFSSDTGSCFISNSYEHPIGNYSQSEFNKEIIDNTLVTSLTYFYKGYPTFKINLIPTYKSQIEISDVTQVYNNNYYQYQVNFYYFIYSVNIDNTTDINNDYYYNHYDPIDNLVVCENTNNDASNRKVGLKVTSTVPNSSIICILPSKDYNCTSNNLSTYLYLYNKNFNIYQFKSSNSSIQAVSVMCSGYLIECKTSTVECSINYENGRLNVNSNKYNQTDNIVRFYFNNYSNSSFKILPSLISILILIINSLIIIN